MGDITQVKDSEASLGSGAFHPISTGGSNLFDHAMRKESLVSNAVMWAVPLLAAGLSMGAAAAPDPLGGLLWKARPLVVVADQTADPRFQQQIAALEARGRALAAYDIKLLPVAGDSAVLRQRLRLPAKGFAVALVGKDGGVKKTWRDPVDPDRILALIDTMPMRQDEVRRRKPN
jgi:hypothetical protein